MNKPTLLLSFFSMSMLAACGDSPVRDVSAPRDGGVNERDAGDATRDAGELPPDGGPSYDGGSRDAGPPRDGGPDDSLNGTTLSGIVVQWDRPLYLCTQWREGRTLEQERAIKAMVVLPPQVRELGRIRLEEATLVDGTLLRGPLAADRVDVSAGVTSTLQEWQLRDPSGDTSLVARVEHVFADGSALEESYFVTRRSGDRTPVVVGGELFESHFTYRAPASTEVAPLERCGGSDRLDPGVDALVGTSGTTSVVVYRYLNTAFAVAGSAPVVPTSASVVLSDRPWEVFRAHGFWAQTYSAQHHNWQEFSVIDFTRDLGWHETAYEPYLDGAQPLASDMIREVRINEVSGLGRDGTIEVDVLDLTNGNTTTQTFTTNGIWRAVDTDRVAFQLASRCANPNVTTIQSGPERYAFQLLSCPGSMGTPFALDMLVPAAFQHAPQHVGQPFQGAAIQPITRMARNGYAVTIGTTTVEITKSPSDQYYFVDVIEGGQPIESSLMFDFPIREPEIRDELHGFASADGTVSATLIRRYAGQGVGESSIYAPWSLELRFGGQTHRAESWDALDYVNTHHNWSDELDGVVDGLRLHWETEFLPAQVNRVSAVRVSDGAVVLAPTEVLSQR